MKPQIKYVSITIARNYVCYYVYYSSGRHLCKFIDCHADKYMLYAMDFLRWSRSIKHITQQLSIHGVIPKSIHNWILSEHPQAEYCDNEFDSDIFTFRLANSDYFFNPECIFNY